MRNYDFILHLYYHKIQTNRVWNFSSIASYYSILNLLSHKHADVAVILTLLVPGGGGARRAPLQEINLFAPLWSRLNADTS